MTLHEEINARREPIQSVYRQVRQLSLDEFLEKIRVIIGSLTTIQITVYSRIYEQERNPR